VGDANLLALQDDNTYIYTTAISVNHYSNADACIYFVADARPSI